MNFLLFIVFSPEHGLACDCHSASAQEAQLLSQEDTKVQEERLMQ
jgi:hypothetical protein